MTDRIAHKYRAFISYSHADTRWAKWLHRALEGFVIDKDLAGRETGMGPVPKSLRPIFRDRDDFTAGHTLGEQTLAALDQSHALIVLCSPKSAQSRYVNEEIRLFKQRHRARPVIPVIVDGRPGGGDDECFAPALRFKLLADGSAGSEPEPDLLAADAREEGDGRHLALAKVAARLLGLSTDDVFRRAERERRRHGRLRMAVASVVGLLFLAGAYLLWQSQERGHTIAQQQQLIAEAAGIAKQLLAANPAAAASPDQEENLVSALSAIQRNAAAGDGDYAKALQLLKDGKAADAVPLLLGAAEEKKRRAVKDTREAAEAYRQAAAIAAVAEPWKARDLYASAVKLDPSNVIGLYQHGDYQREAGQMEEAESAYRRVIALATTADDDWEVHWSYLGLGDIQIARGDLDGAMADFVAAGPTVERNASGDSPHPLWVHALFGWRLKVGDVLLRQRNLADALANFEASRDLAEPQAKANPSDTGWQRDLSLTQERIGNLRKIEGNLPAALEAYRAAHVTAERLAAIDRSNAGWQRDLSVSHAKIGDVLQAQGRFAEALTAYEASVTIAERITRADPANVEWQYNLSNALEGAGEIHRVQGNRPATLAAYQAALAVFERLTSAEPTIPRWQQGLARTCGRIAEMLAQGGGRDEPLRLYRRARETMQPLRQQWPDNADYLKDLTWYNDKIAGLEER